MKLLFGLTYYRPHISGLTLATQRLAEGLAARGHEVTVITSQHRQDLSTDEICGGIRVIRVPSPLRLSKGVIMPTYPLVIAPHIKACDAGILNLPCSPIESLVFSLLCRILGKPMIATLHCDLKLPQGKFNRFIDAVAFTSGLLTGSLAESMITYTEDYARHSPLMRCFPGKRLAIAPPVVIATPERRAVEDFCRRFAPVGEVLIGVPCRFASEKGVEFMLEALHIIRQTIPLAKVVFAGEYKNVIGEEDYIARLMPDILAVGPSGWEFLGVVDPEKMPAFYAACAVIVLPSLNRTESFGLVQVESMICGTPVVASNLPGVRVPVRKTSMGQIVPPGNAKALADAIIDVIKNPEIYRRPCEPVAQTFSVEKTVSAYESLLLKSISKRTSCNTNPI